MNCKNQLFTFILIFACSLGFAQDKNIRQLQITGEGQLTVIPDVGVVNLTISLHRMHFSEVADAMNKRYGEILERLQQKGYKKEDIKTSNYNIRKHEIYRRNVRLDSGYIGTQQLSIEFINTRENLSKIIETFTEGFKEVNAGFYFKLSDESRKKAEQKLIGLAIKNAKERAQTIVDESGVTLGNIIEIKYLKGNSGAPMPAYRFSAMAKDESAENSGGFEIKEIVLNDEIEMIWELE